MLLSRGLLLGLCLLATNAVSAAEQTRITLTGSSTVAPLMLEIGKRFEQRNPHVRVDVQTGGSTRGVTDARSGLADIGMVSRALTPDEHDLSAWTLAMDGIGIIVHDSNPVKHLSEIQIKSIYTGIISNWRELGGGNRPITVVNKAEGRSTLELFLQYYRLRNSEIDADIVIGDNQQGIKSVAGIPGAIAYVSVGAAEFDVAQGVPIRQLPMNGIAAKVENVKNATYPLSRPLNLVVRGNPPEIVRQLIDYALSDAVYDLIEDQYFVPPAR